MRINTNISSMNACRNMSINNQKLASSTEKLSSGYRINGAKDDAAGLSISEKMRSQIRGLNQAARNAEDANSLLQTAEGALNESTSILQRMNELAVQAANDTNVEADRTAIQDEIDALSQELTRIANTTEFNEQKLLDGKFSGTFHIGANGNQNISISIDNMGAKALGVTYVEATSKTVGDLVIENHTAKEVSIEIENGTGTETIADVDENGNITVTLGQDATNKDVIDALDKKGITARIVNEDDPITVDETIIGKENDLNRANDISNPTQFTFGSIVLKNDSDNQDYKITFTKGDNTSVSISENNITITIGTGATNNDVINAINDEKITGVSASLRTINEDDTFTGTTTTLAAGTVNEDKGIDVTSQKAANRAIETIQSAIQKVSSQRSKIGAYQNRLEHTINNLGTSSENLSAAESRIRDVDMATEMSEYTKNSVLVQAAQAMVAQANAQPQSVLSLLQ